MGRWVGWVGGVDGWVMWIVCRVFWGEDGWMDRRVMGSEVLFS